MMVGTYTASRRPASSFLDLQDLVSQAKISIDQKGELRVPMPANSAGAPRKWIEVAPFVWESTDGEERLAAKVENGKVVRWTFGPTVVFDRTPWYRDSSWLLPVLVGSFAVVLVTALSWPVSAIARRRFGATLALAGRDRIRYRLLRVASWLVILIPIGWAMALSRGVNGGSGLTAAILVMQTLGAAGFLGLFGLAVWNATATYRGARSWFAKLWATLIISAAFFILWVAYTFHLLSFTTDY